MRCLIMVLWLFFAAAPVAAQTEKALLEAVKAKLDQVTDYVAVGTMTVDAAFIKAPASGITVYYQKPNRFKVKKQDGISLLPKGGLSMNLSALLGGTNYTTVGAGTARIGRWQTRVVKLLPLDDESNVILSTFYIDEQALLVRKARVSTRENGSYEMDFSYGRYAAWGLPDAVLFTFNTKEYKLPKGLTFEYENGAEKKKAPTATKGRVQLAYTSYRINQGISSKLFL